VKFENKNLACKAHFGQCAGLTKRAAHLANLLFNDVIICMMISYCSFPRQVGRH